MITAAVSGLQPVRTELENGAVVIVQETSLTPAVTISAAFRAGSVHEPPEKAGLAFLTGRVLDRGTEQRTADAIAEELDDRGVSIRVSVNRHALALTCTCLTEDFDEILSVVADVARRPVFPPDEIEKRRIEVLTALRQDADNPATRALQGVLRLLYGEQHPYGRPPRGTVETVERLRRDDLVQFHHDRVRPASLSLVIVGDVPVAHATARAAGELAGWTAPLAARADVSIPRAPSERREQIIPMPGKPQSDIAYGFIAVRRLDPRYYAYWMMNNILGQFGLGGRLADNIRERQGMAYYAYSGFDPSPAEAPLVVRAGVAPENVRRAIAAIDNEVRALAVDGPTTREVEATREFLVGSIPRLLETNQSIATFLQNVEEFGLGLDHDRKLPALLRAVTIDEIRSAAAETLHPERAAIAIAGPTQNSEL
jgi:zinc protease